MFRTIVGLLIIFSIASCNKSLVKDSPEMKQAKAQMELGMGYLKQNKNKMAIDKIRSAVEIAPDYADANHALALAYQQTGIANEAEIYFKKALKLDSKNSRLHNNYGTFLCQQNRIDESEQYFLTATNDPLYETPAQAYENAGLCMLRANRVKKAELYLRKALKISASLPVALREMAFLSYAQEKYIQTRAFIQRFEELDQLDAKSLWIAIQVERKLGDLAATDKYTAILKANFPESDEVRHLSEHKEGS